MAANTNSLKTYVNVTSYLAEADGSNGSASVMITRRSWTMILASHSPMAVYVDRTLTPLWYLVGLLGNLLSAIVWSQRPMRRNNSSAFYLTSLCVSDMFFLVLHSLQELKYAWLLRTLEYPVVCELYFLLILVFQYLSPALVLCFTVERFIAVCHPFAKEKYCTDARAVKIVISLVVVCVTLCAIQAYFWRFNSAIGECEIRPEVEDGGNYSLWSIWTWVTELTMFLGVPLVILVFNIFVIVEVRKMSRTAVVLVPLKSSRESRGGNGVPNATTSAATTVMLLSVSFYVIATTLPATLVYVLHSQFPVGDDSLTDDEISRDPVWQRFLVYFTVRKIVEEICLSHYACNVFLYLVTGPQFRAAFLGLVCRGVHEPGAALSRYNLVSGSRVDSSIRRMNLAHV